MSVIFKMLFVATIFATMSSFYPSGRLAFFEKSGGRIEMGNNNSLLFVYCCPHSKDCFIPLSDLKQGTALLHYLSAVSRNRCSIAATSARVALPAGSRIPLPLPCTIF